MWTGITDKFGLRPSPNDQKQDQDALTCLFGHCGRIDVGLAHLVGPRNLLGIAASLVCGYGRVNTQ